MESTRSKLFAFKEADTEYILRLDIDHFVNLDNIKKLMNLSIDHDVYFFNRNLLDGTIKKSARNIYLINKYNYKKINGYNEYFSGSYGDDMDFYPRLITLKCVVNEDIVISINNNGGTKLLSRDLTETNKKLQDVNRPFLKYMNKNFYIKQIKNYSIKNYKM